MSARRLLLNRVFAEWLLLASLLFAATALAASQGWLWRLDLVLYDVALSFWERKPATDIVIVAIDDLSIAEIGRWPWPRGVHATLLGKLTEARAVALDVILSEPDTRDRAGDAALAQAIRDHGRTVLPVHMEAGPGGVLSETLPIPEFAASVAALGHIQLALDRDGIARSIYLKEGLGRARWPHLALALLEVAEPGRLRALPGSRKPASPDKRDFWIRDHWVHIPFAGPPGHYREVSYADVLRGETASELIRDKLVVVGMTATGSVDAHPTPSAGEGRPMPGIEIVANTLDALKSGIALTRWNGWPHVLLSCVPVLALLVAFLWLTPRQSLLASGVMALACVVASVLTLRLLRVWVPPSAALTTALICYPLWSWRRLEATQDYLGEELARLRAEPGLLPEPGSTPPLPATLDAVEARVEAVRAAVERVRQLRQFLSDVGMSLPDGALVADETGRVLLANSRAAEFLHTPSVRSLRGCQLSEVLQPLELPAGASFTELFAQAPASMEARHPDGRDLMLNVVPCVTELGRRIGLIVRLADVSAFKQAAREREELLRFLSHDMRSPQASILALIERQRASAAALPETELLRRIERHALRTLNLADDFVQLARAEARDPREFAPVDLVAISHEAADEAWALAAAKRIRLERRIELEEAWVRGDRQLLARALANLLSNAVKYSLEASTVSVRLMRDAGGIACSIADQGSGIAVEVMPRLFQRFQLFEGNTREQGAGLGLALVKTVAEKHAGRVTVTSEPGRGSCFTLCLPEVPAEEPAAWNRRESPADRVNAKQVPQRE